MNIEDFNIGLKLIDNYNNKENFKGDTKNGKIINEKKMSTLNLVVMIVITVAALFVAYRCTKDNPYSNYALEYLLAVCCPLFYLIYRLIFPCKTEKVMMEDLQKGREMRLNNQQ